MNYKTNVWRPFRKDLYREGWYNRKITGVVREFGRDLRRSYERIRKGYCDFDTFDIDSWFLGLMPAMLQEFKDNLHGCPVSEDSLSHSLLPDGDYSDDMKKWKNTLDQMIFLLKEANEDTCSRRNPYEEEYDRICDEFYKKYGAYGEELMTEEQRKAAEQNYGRRMHFPRDVKKYRSLTDKYMKEEYDIGQYRKDCKDEFFRLFSRWFYALWD